MAAEEAAAAAACNWCDGEASVRTGETSKSTEAEEEDELGGGGRGRGRGDRWATGTPAAGLTGGQGGGIDLLGVREEEEGDWVGWQASDWRTVADTSGGAERGDLGRWIAGASEGGTCGGARKEPWCFHVLP